MDENIFSNHQNIIDVANGAIQERLQVELHKIIKNIVDPNTEAEKPRAITIKLEFKPTEYRDSVFVKADIVSKLQPYKGINAQLAIQETDSEPLVMEVKHPTQISMFEDDKKIIKMMNVDKE